MVRDGFVFRFFSLAANKSTSKYGSQAAGIAMRIIHFGANGWYARFDEGFDEIKGTQLDHLPVCIAKTQFSFSADPKEIGRAHV